MGACGKTRFNIYIEVLVQCLFKNNTCTRYEIVMTSKERNSVIPTVVLISILKFMKMNYWQTFYSHY